MKVLIIRLLPAGGLKLSGYGVRDPPMTDGCWFWVISVIVFRIFSHLHNFLYMLPHIVLSIIFCSNQNQNNLVRG